jgi:hypothetical protein
MPESERTKRVGKARHGLVTDGFRKEKMRRKEVQGVEMRLVVLNPDARGNSEV